MILKLERLINRTRWKVFFYKKSGNISEKIAYNFGFKSVRRKPKNEPICTKW